MGLTSWRIDRSEWPVVRLALERRDDGAEPDFETFLARSNELLATGERFAVVIDLHGNHANAERRSRLAAWYRAHQPSVARQVVAVAVVASSALHRGVVTAMSWLVTSPMPVASFAAAASARAWARQQMFPRARRDVKSAR